MMMNKRKMEDLKEMACKALEQIREEDLQRETGAGKAKNLASLVLKLFEMCEKDGYSNRGMNYSRGGYPMGEIDPYDERSYSMRGSSYHGGSDIMERLERMQRESRSPAERSMIDRIMKEIRE